MKHYSDFWFDRSDTDIDELLGIEKVKPKKEPEAKTDPVNAVEEKPQETETLETELEPTKEMEK